MVTSTSVPRQSVMAASVYTWICRTIYNGKILINNFVISFTMMTVFVKLLRSYFCFLVEKPASGKYYYILQIT